MSGKQKRIVAVAGTVLLLVLVLWRGRQETLTPVETADPAETADSAGNSDSVETSVSGEITDPAENLCFCVTSLRADDREGSCVILQKEEENYILATASHVVSKKPETVELAGQEVLLTGYYKSGDYDLAFLAVQTKDESVNLLPALLDTGAYENVQGGEEIMLCGMAAGEKISQKGELLDKWIYIEDFGYHMLWGKAENIRGGMSGGGVFDRQGRLLGLLLGSGGEDEIVALPLAIMAGEWKRSDFAETIDIFSK